MSEAVNAPKVKLVPWWLVLIEGVLLIIIGIFLLTNPASTFVTIVWVLGIYWLISGIFNIIKIFFDSSMWGWKLFAGIVGIIAGWFLIQNPIGGSVVVSATTVLLLGLFGIFIGIVNIIQAFKGAGWGTGILGVISIILGIILLANRFLFTFSLPWALGIMAIIGGIIAIFNSFRIRSAKKDLEEAADAAQARAATMADTADTRSAAATAATVGAAGAVAAAAKDEADDAADATADAADDAVDEAGDAVDEAADTVEDADDASAAKAAAAVAAAAAVSESAEEADVVEEAEVVEAEEAVDETAAGVAAAAVLSEAVEEVEEAADEVEEADTRSAVIDIEPEEKATVAAALVAAVRSLDPTDAEKLAEAGIVKPGSLLERGASRQGRAAISKETGVDESTVLKWINDLDLARIKGVGVIYSDLLENAGVDTVVELAQRNAANLYKKLVEVNEAQELVKDLPSAEEVAEWVAQAKELPRVITY